MKTVNTLIDLALSQSQSAVEEFAIKEQSIQKPNRKDSFYLSLIPSSFPEKGEQYAFEVDVDRCSSCKACVSACHHMNGLSQDESWRRVQQWFGENETTSWVHTVTSACHHCVNAECMNGCPVGAYEKSPFTGIVKHLDDQCIGCEYCIWKCPYEVPRYHEQHGVVRKCDMCSDRLANHQEPACVQACPHDAIRIGIADQDLLFNELTSRRENGSGLYPGAAPSSITLPTTTYRSKRSQKAVHWTPYQPSLISAKPHWPLIHMLIMTQWGIGMLISSLLISNLNGTNVEGRWGYGIGIMMILIGL